MYLCATRFFWHDYKIYEQNDIFQMTIPMTSFKLFKINFLKSFLCCFFQRAKRGQYQVIDKIAAYLDYLNPGVDEAKAHIDHIIDLCGVPPSGNYSD